MTSGRQKTRFLLIAGTLLAAVAVSALDRSTEPVGRVLEKQTQAAVTRDYLQAWKNLGSALGENRSDLLDASFVGPAQEKLAETIKGQQQLGIKTIYTDTKHNFDVVFYSPEGLSIQVVDNVEYNIQVIDHDKVLQTQHVRSRYVAILTPTEVRWKVRILQAAPGQTASLLNSGEAK
jgi:hypothetical protein